LGRTLKVPQKDYEVASKIDMGKKLSTEEVLNEKFKEYCEISAQGYISGAGEHHKCYQFALGDNILEVACPYLLKSDNYSALDNGQEFSKKLSFWLPDAKRNDNAQEFSKKLSFWLPDAKRNEMPEDAKGNASNTSHKDKLAVLSRYVGSLYAILIGKNASDSAVERSKILCYNVLSLLRGIIQRNICKVCCESRTEDLQQHWQELKSLQEQMARFGLVEHILNILGLTVDEFEFSLFQISWDLLISLTLGGNPEVQKIIVETLKKPSMIEMKCFVNVRDELQFCNEALVGKFDHLAFLQEMKTDLTQQHYEQEVAALDGNISMSSLNSHGSQGSVSLNSSGSTFSDAVLAENSYRTKKESIDQAMKKIRNLDDDDEKERLLDLCFGLQCLGEGGYPELQTFLRDQTSLLPVEASVNLMKELCFLLNRFYKNASEGEDWLEIICQILRAINELCAGNQLNQQEALNCDVVKAINGIMSTRSKVKLKDVKTFIKMKECALNIIGSMLESSNAEAKKMALELEKNLNIPLIYANMNRFYYMQKFLSTDSIKDYFVDRENYRTREALKERINVGYHESDRAGSDDPVLFLSLTLTFIPPRALPLPQIYLFTNILP
jgi:RyR and IP3R Homology associated